LLKGDPEDPEETDGCSGRKVSMRGEKGRGGRRRKQEKGRRTSDDGRTPPSGLVGENTERNGSDEGNPASDGGEGVGLLIESIVSSARGV
jgi:hypothetical protein